MFEAFVFLAFLALVCCAGLCMCTLVYRPVADCLALGNLQDLEAMKEQMTTMMEIMMSMRKMMKDNTTTIIVVSTATEMDSIHPPDFNKVNRPISDVVGQGGKAVKNEYGLPPNYISPTVVYASGENISNFATALIENQQPQFDHAYVSHPMKFPKIASTPIRRWCYSLYS